MRMNKKTKKLINALKAVAAPIATADGSDAATTQALANATKTAFNTLANGIDAL